MFVLLFLLSFDSLPPLPDLSRITFPEPPLWMLGSDHTIDITAGAGEFIFAGGRIGLHTVTVSADYTNRLRWGTVRYGTGDITCTLAFPHLWLQPVVDGFSMKRDDEYYRITPGFNFATTNQWSVMRGTVGYTIWDINTARAIEAATRFDIIVDRTANKPHVWFQGIYTNDRYYQIFGGGIHIQDFHIMAASPVTDFFPSPCVSIASSHPSYRIAAEIKTGAVLRTLTERFDPYVPVHYTATAPVESLRVATRLGMVLDLYDHSLELAAVYRNWYNRLSPASGYFLRDTIDVQEMEITLTMHNAIAHARLRITHMACGKYFRHDSRLPFQPRYTIVDTLVLAYRFAYAQIALEYRSAHQGIVIDIPSSFLVDPKIGISYRSVTLFAVVMNCTGTQCQYYDGYRALPRAFAAGVQFKTAF